MRILLNVNTFLYSCFWGVGGGSEFLIFILVRFKDHERKSYATFFFFFINHRVRGMKSNYRNKKRKKNVAYNGIANF